MGAKIWIFPAFDVDSVSRDQFATPSLPWWCTVPARWWSRGQWPWPQPAGLRWCRQPGWPGWCWTGACAPCAGCRRCCRPPAAPPAGHSGHMHLHRDKEKDVHVERKKLGSGPVWKLRWLFAQGGQMVSYMTVKLTVSLYKVSKL